MSSPTPEALFALVELGENDEIAHWLETQPESRESLLLIVYMIRRNFQCPDSDDRLMEVSLWAEEALRPFSNIAQAWALDQVAAYEISQGRLEPEAWNRARAESFAREEVLVTTKGA